MARGQGREHDAIRQAILDAAGALVGTSGVEALTFRRVAAAAEVSPGRVQHYFPDRAALVHGCFDDVQDKVRVRVQASLEAVEPEPAAVVTAILRAMIPRSPAQLEELRVVTIFETLALTEPTLESALQAGHAELRQLLEIQVGLALGAGMKEADGAHIIDPETIARSLLAVAEGLAGEVLHKQLGPDEADRILDTVLAHRGIRNAVISVETANDA
jgi:AcrR family transcriptional regulator